MTVLKRSLFFAVLLVAVLFSVQAFAETESPNSLTIHFEREKIPTIVENMLDIELCDESGVVSFGAISHQLSRDEVSFDVIFDLPRYPAGTKFLVNVSDGVKGTSYDGKYGYSHMLDTRSGNEFTLKLDCYWEKEASITMNGRASSHKYVMGTDDVYVPREFFEALGIKSESHLNEAKPYIKFHTDSYHIVLLYPGDIYAVFGEDAFNLAYPIPEVDGEAYYPLSKVAVYFACNYNVVTDTGYLTEVSLTSSVYTDKYIKEVNINSQNISSKTNYMIWVSKKDFEVNIFTGSENNWELDRTYTCSIGAPATPTIEGQFEYHQWQERWTYSDHYCGPIMRFYNGYAFHSYLIRYNGKPYDGRLGMRVSHGCVRMHPNDIGWMAANIPLYTKVYITP